MRIDPHTSILARLRLSRSCYHATVERKVYDYNLASNWGRAIFHVLFGSIFTSGWIFAAVQGPLIARDHKTGIPFSSIPGWTACIPALLGLLSVAIGVIMAIKASSEKVTVEGGTLTFTDWSGREAIRCRLSEVNGIQLVPAPFIYRKRGLIDQAYQVATVHGSFVFLKTIRNEDDLLRLISDQVSLAHARPEQAPTPSAPLAQ
jgi:hypothetical protein